MLPSFIRRSKSLFAALGFLAPNLLGFLLFTLFPVALSFVMAFTNWSLKPAIPLKFVGLRNFTDLLGVRATDSPGPGWIAPLYILCVIVLAVSLAGALWTVLARMRGVRLGGMLFALLGAVLVVGGEMRGAPQACYIGAFLLMVLGWWSWSAGAGWNAFGRGTLPGLGVLIAGAGLCTLHGPMWTAFDASDARFWQYFYNTVYLMLALPVGIAGSLGLAMLLNEKLPTGDFRRCAMATTLCLVCGAITFGIFYVAGWRDAGLLGGFVWLIAALGFACNVTAFRTLFYLPTFTSGVALMILWKALYNPQTGPINALLGGFTGLTEQNLPQWLGSIALAKPALMIMGVWTAIGGMNMLLYLAALTNVPGELIEAADIDGASKWQKFSQVVWPQLAPTTFFIGVMSIIGGLQGGFEQARVMTQGGPAGATTTLSYYIYTTGFEDLNFGYASAISWILFAILFAITAINWRFGKDLDV